MKKIYYALLIILISAGGHAQTPDFEWAASVGGNSFDHGNYIATDASGNVYVTGFFNGMVDFDPGAGIFNLSSTGGSDIFILKLDAGGNLIWAKSFGGGFQDISSSLDLDASNNVYVTGHFSNTVDFDPGVPVFNVTSNGSTDVFVLKLDANGNFVWVRTIGNADFDDGDGIAIDVSGNSYIIGTFAGTMDFDPGAGVFNQTALGFQDLFIQKLDANGNFIWAKSMGGLSSSLVGEALEVTANGNIYITGQLFGTVDADPGVAIFNITSNGSADAFVQKLDTNGNFDWAASMGGPSIDEGSDISVDEMGNVYTTGVFQGTIDFDPGPATFNLMSLVGAEVFIQKLDANGNFVWAKSTSSTANSLGHSIHTDAFNDVYITGFYEGDTDFDPGPAVFNLTPGGRRDIFILKLDVNGDFDWVESIGNMSDNEGIYLTVDAMNNIYVTGYFNDTVDFDPGAATFDLISEGISDCYVLKLSQCVPNTGTDVISACEPYIWIDGITYTMSNNSAMDTLLNAGGCDSVVTLDLTITSVDASITNEDPTITANASGAAYQWLDCDDNFATISGATMQTFTPSANGDYAVEVTQNSCTDISICSTILTIGVNENPLLEEVSLFPNPTSGDVTIQLGSLKNTSIGIFTLDGRLMHYVENIHDATYSFEFSAEPGLYLVEVISSKEKKYFKLLKK